MSCKRAPNSPNSVDELKKCWTNSTVASSPLLNIDRMKPPAEPKTAPSKLDSLREHELFRYFQPPTEIVTANAASSPDTTLTALAQLCALRLNAKRAMISVLDREKQYFIAESTKTLNLLDNEKFEAEGDELWFGCGVVDKAGRLCEKTVELPPTQGRTPCFTVTDLAKDEAFNQLPFVAGPPYFKYYAGTPLTTKRGINIGSIFIIDDVVRPPLSLDQESFLGTISQTVMRHMETTSEAEERKKVMRLSHGMNAFVEGKTKLLLDDKTYKLGLGLKSGTGSDPKQDVRSRSIVARSSKDPVSLVTQRSADHSGSPSDPETSQDDSDAGISGRTVDTNHRMTFARAANILCDSLDVRHRGGIVFFDATARSRHTNSQPGVDSSERTSQRPAEVVSFSTAEETLGFPDQCGKITSFNPVDEALLHSLLTKYPRGKMWSFDQEGCMSSSEEEALSPRERSESEARRMSRTTRKYLEANLLQKHFPGVRQLMLSGLWDAGSSRWFSAGFAWTTSGRQIFNKETELSFFMAFGNSVMAEVSRLASIASDRQKADFIGSISHEFRSPLHGILASAEFLAETEVDAFQSSLVDTVSSCGRTLLDTINHILDYSKINSFERSWRNIRKPGSKIKGAASRRITDKEAPPMMNIYATIDVAAITEEVIEGVYAGQTYQDISSTDATSFSLGAKAEAVDHSIGNQTRRKTGLAKEVEVIIDIAHENYVFTTQPGALKRVIMNIFGNALKYTQKGSIVVKLSLDESPNNVEDPAEERTLQIRVTDTGKGISSEYLRTSLFNPFCQEDVLASGTGLGLSIVKSIVTMLRGSIDVQSEVGTGTEVTIRVPLSRLPGNTTPVSTPSTITTEGSGDDSIEELRSIYTDVTIALHGFSNQKDNTLCNVSGQALKDYIEDWFGLRISSTLSGQGAVDLVIVDEKSIPYVLRHDHNLPTIVLCSNATRSHALSRHHPSAQPSPTIMEFVSKPVGPHKLAKAVRICLDKAKNFKSGLAPTIIFPEEESPMESETGTVVPELGNLTLETETGMQQLQVQSDEVVTASDSENAQMAIDNSSSEPTTVELRMTDSPDFPFPITSLDGEADGETVQDEKMPLEKQKAPSQDRPKGDLVRKESRRPPLVSRNTEPLTRVPFRLSSTYDDYGEMATYAVRPPPEDLAAAKRDLLPEKTVASLTASNVAIHARESSSSTIAMGETSEQDKRPPRLLLVDDNKINLRLLETYMKKRQYKLVDSAENGESAVKAAERQEYGYDIIFMDISMPVMNGFEATRAIRDIEEARNHNNKDGKARPPALIIALTGLASSRDQSEAFTSGVDLFMTKPVSFKEVGRLLDNWEAHGGIKPLEENERL